MVNGNREMSSNVMLDGVDDNFRRNALITVRPSVEDIQEFKMQTNLFGAEQAQFRRHGQRHHQEWNQQLSRQRFRIHPQQRSGCPEFFQCQHPAPRSSLHVIRINSAPASAARSSATSFSSLPITRAFASSKARSPARKHGADSRPNAEAISTPCVRSSTRRPWSRHRRHRAAIPAQSSPATSSPPAGSIR